MTHTQPLIAIRHSKRVCLACGYTGPEVQIEHGPLWTCPSCGEDLYARPPRSYAEMEGFTSIAPRRQHADRASGAGRSPSRIGAKNGSRVKRLKRFAAPVAMGIGAMGAGAAAAWLVILLV